MPFVITVCHRSASLVMPNCDPRDRFFFPTLTLVMNSYNMYMYETRREQTDYVACEQQKVRPT